MFIKFSDKTKKIMVKNSREEIDDGYLDQDCIYLDEKNNENRRLKALLDADEEQSDSAK